MYRSLLINMGNKSIKNNLHKSNNLMLNSNNNINGSIKRKLKIGNNSHNNKPMAEQKTLRK